MKLIKEEAAIEAILFASGEPVSFKSIAESIGYSVSETIALTKNLADKYKEEKRGIKIVEVGEAFQFCTSPEYFTYVKKFCSAPKKYTLTQTLLETLAIVAYKQPITKASIEKIRGVNAEHAVNKLMEYGLLEEKGRLDAPGKPILFGTTDEFLRCFGFSNLDVLPKFETDDEAIKKEAQMEIDELLKK